MEGTDVEVEVRLTFAGRADVEFSAEVHVEVTLALVGGADVYVQVNLSSDYSRCRDGDVSINFLT